MEWYNYVNPIVGLLLWIYGIYCMIKGGTHAKGKGWVSKYTHPVTYRINQTIYLVIGFFTVVSFFIFNR